MANLNKELMILVMQFLREEKYKDTVHKLEQESGVFFNMKYLEDKVHAGEWVELEKYISGFTKFDDNRYSMKIFFEIRKQKFLEALDRNERGRAVEILRKDLKLFATFNEELYKEFTQLLTLDNFRENEQLSKYGDTKSTRTMLLMELKRLVESNPQLREKLTLPFIKPSRLQALINQSLNWQHHLCRNPRTNPQMHSLFVDHSCSTSNGVPTSAPLTVSAGVGKSAATTFQHLGAHGSFQPTAAATNANALAGSAATNANALAGWMRNAAGPQPAPPMTIAGSSTVVQPNHGQNFSAVPVLKRPRTPPIAPGTDHEQSTKRSRLFGQPVDEVTYQAPWSLDDLPRTVVFSNLQASSHVTSFDFHPSQQTLLLVGSGNAEVALWEIASRERLVSKPFKIWNMSTCSAPFQASIVKDSKISINRVTWNPDGNFIGVAYTKHLIQLYTFRGRDLHEHIEIDAHVGSVNDLAFSYRMKQVCVVSCGDDKLIKVWDLAGQKLFNFEGHDAPVYSICTCHRDNLQFFLSTSINGQIKAWLYDTVGSIVDYGAPGHGRSTMLYSADGTRLFSCGTNKDGYVFLVEWNESEGSIKRTYTGFKKKSAGNLQFDTSKNRFLAVGEDHQIKFWDMDHTNILSNTEADGGLGILPCLRFNKEGNLLAVTTAENGFKVLANTEALRSLRAKSRSIDVSRSLNEASARKVSGSTSVVNTSQTITRVVHNDGSSPPSSAILNEDDPAIRSIEIPRTSERLRRKVDTEGVVEITDPANCQVVDMPNSADCMSKVAQLLYTNTGGGILALGSNGIQKIWKWNRDEQNPSGKATAGAVPQHWQPTSGLLMINDVPEINLAQAETCIALSKNDSYVMSASGGKVSLFNMMTFKVLTKFMSPSPATTCLAFHPQDNNIIAAGAEDGTVKIYNVRFDEVLTKWKSHQDCTNGLCFSTKLNILVTSGSDCMVRTWSTNTWLKRRSVELEMPAGKLPVGDTRVQFHSDHVLLLAFHETQLAIYDATDMQRIRRWVPQARLSAPITYAAYSCNSELIYSAFTDGNIGIFYGASLALKCLIAPSAYMSQVTSNRNQPVYPRVVATHPLEPNQCAVGLTNGTVKVIEPLESEGKWGMVVVFVEDEAPNNNIEAPAAPETTPSVVSESVSGHALTATAEPIASSSVISNPSSEKLQK